jgi:hypothetical protein
MVEQPIAERASDAVGEEESPSRSSVWKRAPTIDRALPRQANLMKLLEEFTVISLVEARKKLPMFEETTARWGMDTKTINRAAKMLEAQGKLKRATIYVPLSNGKDEPVAVFYLPTATLAGETLKEFKRRHSAFRLEQFTKRTSKIRSCKVKEEEEKEEEGPDE